MRFLKKGKMLSKKTISIILASFVLITATGYTTFQSYKNKKEESQFKKREREYKVTRGNLTAGVKGSGVLKFETIKHNFEESVVIGEVFVKEGQRVKPGDKLASISEKYLDDKLEELNKSLNEANLVLQQANGDKESSYLSDYKMWNEKIQGSKLQYENQKREINDSINSINNRLNDANGKLSEIRKQIKDLSGNGGDNSTLINELKIKEEALVLEQNSIKDELNSANKRLSNLEADRENQLISEGEEAESNNALNDIKMKNINGVISKAQGEVDKIQKSINKLNELKESPILYTETEGVVFTINSQPGSTTTLEGSIVDIGVSTKVTAEVTISQNDVVNVKEGQEVKLNVSTYQDEEFTGKVKFINLKPNTQGSSTAYSATIEIDKNDYDLLDGMAVSAQFIVKEVKDVIILSNKAIVLKDGKQFVKKKNKDGSITATNIQTGFSDGKNTEIISGLNEGDTVVVGG